MARRYTQRRASAGRSRPALLALVAVLSAGCASSGPKLALVVGNGAYANTPALDNPTRDATAIAASLRELGWSVTTGLDQSKADFDAMLAEASPRIDRAEQVIFFYAGHGMQIDGRNYLVPVDFAAEAIDLETDLVSLDGALSRLDRPHAQLVVFLDACRDNPLTTELARQARASRGISIDWSGDPAAGHRRPGQLAFGRGLAEVAADAGTFIAYATEPGNVALDGEGEHSPFTRALLRHIGSRGKEIGWILQRVRNDVIDETEGRQVPWDHSSLTRDFIVVEERRSAPPP